MVTFHQLIQKNRTRKQKKNKVPALKANPQQKGICVKIVIKSPKKPHSGKKKVVKLRFKKKLRRQIFVYIPGIGHDIKAYDNILFRGGRRRDVPGLKYTLIRGKYDIKALSFDVRKTSRSKYGIKKTKGTF